MKILQGYTFTRDVEGLMIPTNIQSSILRNYCRDVNAQYKLHLDEYCFKKCYIQLHQIIKSKLKLDGIVVCSVMFFPSEKKELTKIFQLCKQKKMEVHFVFENIVFKNQAITNFVNYIIKNRQINYTVSR